MSEKSEKRLALTGALRAFLAGVKVAETVSSELRDEITVETNLEAALKSAVAAHRDVVVAGSAGGGKTHLLRTLDDAIRTSEWPNGRTPEGEFVRVVPDATAAIDHIIQGGLAERPSNCIAQVIAINEGPLLELAGRHGPTCGRA